MVELGFEPPSWLVEMARQHSGGRVVAGWESAQQRWDGQQQEAVRTWVDGPSGRIFTQHVATAQQQDAGNECGAAVPVAQHVAAVCFRDCQGPPGLVHGGAILSAFDNVLVAAASPAVLRTLRVRFRRPLPLAPPDGRVCRLTTTCEPAEQRGTVSLTAELTDDDGEVIGAAVASAAFEASSSSSSGISVSETSPAQEEELSTRAARVPVAAGAVTAPPVPDGWVSADEGSDDPGVATNRKENGEISFLESPALPVLQYLWNPSLLQFRGVYGL